MQLGLKSSAVQLQSTPSVPTRNSLWNTTSNVVMNLINTRSSARLLLIWTRDWCLHKNSWSNRPCYSFLFSWTNCELYVTSSSSEMEQLFNEHIVWNEFQLKVKKAAHWDWNGKGNSSQMINYPDWSLTKMLLFSWYVSWGSSWSKAVVTLTWVLSFLFHT